MFRYFVKDNNWSVNPAMLHGTGLHCHTLF